MSLSEGFIFLTFAFVLAGYVLLAIYLFGRALVALTLHRRARTSTEAKRNCSPDSVGGKQPHRRIFSGTGRDENSGLCLPPGFLPHPRTPVV